MKQRNEFEEFKAELKELYGDSNNTTYVNEQVSKELRIEFGSDIYNRYINL